MRVRELFQLWLPLAVSFELMMLEGPVLQSAIGWMADPTLHLAAWSLTMQLSLIIESPVIMLLATAIALAKNGPSFLALSRFTVNLCIACTAVTAVVAFTPLFDFLAGAVLGYKPAHIEAARPAMQIMLLWTAAIGWRRFCQGVLVRHGYTRMVSWGTAIRLLAVTATALWLAMNTDLTGSQVAAIGIMAAVMSEAVASTLFARPVVKRDVLPTPDDGTELTQRGIWKFHLPLAVTTLLTLLAMPITSAALARLPQAKETLAVWPVVFMLLLVMRGWGLALQEIAVSQGGKPQAHRALRRFTWMVGLATTGATGLIALTPLIDLYLIHIIRLDPALHEMARVGVIFGLGLPLLTALGSWRRGLLVAVGDTPAVYRGMAVNVGSLAALLALGVWFGVPGIWLAGLAFTASSIFEYIYLLRAMPPVPSPAPELEAELTVTG